MKICTTKVAVPILLILTIICVYSNTLYVPFFFDDIFSITKNPTIKDIQDLSLALSPPHGSGLTVEGRPLLNLSLALNYAISGEKVWSYHLTNIIIHILASLTLYGIIRKTLNNKNKFTVSETEATYLAIVVAVIWAVHPLQTESVTYTIQRAESLMGLFYLMTLYFYICGNESNNNTSNNYNMWLILSVLTAYAGMATKEVMISAPVCILAYAWCFQTNSFKSYIIKNRIYFLSLISSILLISILAIKTGNRGGTSGFGIGVSPYNYWMTQPQAICHYIYLSFWPDGLIFDYGTEWAKNIIIPLLYLLIIFFIIILVLIKFCQREPLGFLGLIFFIVLAPTSIIPGARQTIAEHRMYLPLASIVTILIYSFYFKIKKYTKLFYYKLPLYLIIIVVCILGTVTRKRNELYNNTLDLYRDNIAKRPNNYFAHNYLGIELSSLANSQKEAEEQYNLAIKSKPDYAEAHANLGLVLQKIAGRENDSFNESKLAALLKPDYAEAHYDLAISYSKLKDDKKAAIEEYETCIKLRPDFTLAHNNLAVLLTDNPEKLKLAINHFKEAIKYDINYFEAYSNLAELLLKKTAFTAESIDYYNYALKLKPNDYKCLKGLSSAYILNNEPIKAIDSLNCIAKIDPTNADAYLSLALIYSQIDSYRYKALYNFEKAITLRPEYIKYYKYFSDYK